MTMTTQKGGSPVFYALLILCLVMIWRQRGTRSLTVDRDYKAVFWACCLPLLAVSVSMIGHGQWAGTNVEAALRVSLGLPVLTLGLLHADQRLLRHGFWGLYAAVWAATGYVVYLSSGSFPNFVRPVTEIYNPVGYGSLLLLLTVLACFSLLWQLTRRPRLEVAFKLTTVVAGFGAFMLTQTRTGWLAIPVFVVIGLVLIKMFKRPLRAFILLLGVLAVFVAIGATSPALRDRAQLAYTESIECTGAESTADTSICIRFQLWRSAWDMFESSPWIGLGGNDSFEERLRSESLPKGLVSQFVVDNFGETHNDMLLALVNFGIFGGIGLLMVYFAPLWVFLRRLRQKYPDATRTAAAMGVAVCLGFAIFGLTELMFRGMRTLAFYVTLVALFFVLSDPKKYQAESRRG